MSKEVAAAILTKAFVDHNSNVQQWVRDSSANQEGLSVAAQRLGIVYRACLKELQRITD